MALVKVRYFAGARAASGVAEESVDAVTIGALVDTIGARGEKLARTLKACCFLVDELAVRDLDAPLPEGATVDVLPPFAGG